MKGIVMKVLPFALFSLVACAVESEPRPASMPAPIETSAATLDVSAVASELTLEASTSAAPPPGCYDYWDCLRCPNNTTRNVVVRACSDGTEHVIRSRGCGENCF